MDTTTDLGILGTILAGLGGVASGFFAARRKLSKDKVELAKDRVELDILTILTKQRDEALEEIKAKKADFLQVEQDKKTAIQRSVQIEQELSQLRQKVALQKQLISRLSSTLDLTKQELTRILESNVHSIVGRGKVLAADGLE